jgi:hypothetical protein
MPGRSLEDMEERAHDGYADPEDVLTLVGWIRQLTKPKDDAHASDD